MGVVSLSLEFSGSLVGIWQEEVEALRELREPFIDPALVIAELGVEFRAQSDLHRQLSYACQIAQTERDPRRGP